MGDGVGTKGDLGAGLRTGLPARQGLRLSQVFQEGRRWFQGGARNPRGRRVYTDPELTSGLVSTLCTRPGAVRGQRLVGCGGSRISLPSPQPRVLAKLKIELNVQIRPARPGGRSLGAGLCPPPYPLWMGRRWGEAPCVFKPPKIILVSCVSTERLCQEWCVPGPYGGLGFLSGKPTSDFKHFGTVPFSAILDTQTRASVAQDLLIAPPPLEGASLSGPSGSLRTSCSGYPPSPKPAPSSSNRAGLL